MDSITGVRGAGTSALAALLGGRLQQARLLQLDTPLDKDAQGQRVGTGVCVPHHGYVHTARRLGSDGNLTTYQVIFSSWLHFLWFRKDARIWQDKTADQIITDVFQAHPQAQGAFRFMLSATLASRSFCVQYENDWHFVHRLMEQEGLYGYFEQAADGSGHTFVIVDHLDAFQAMQPQQVTFSRAGIGAQSDALTQWTDTRTLQSVTLSTRTYDYKAPATAAQPKATTTQTMPTQGALPQQAEVYEYTGAYSFNAQGRGDTLSTIRMQEWESRAKRFHGVGAYGVSMSDAGSR